MASAINIYSYTAASNPYFVKCIAHKYGYTYDKGQNLGSVLQQLVAMEGEPVLMEIIENNPDKELFFDYYQKKFPQEEKKDLNHTLRGKVGVVKRVISYFSLVLNYMEMASIFLKMMT
jgi:hypothetical protein